MRNVTKMLMAAVGGLALTSAAHAAMIQTTLVLLESDGVTPVPQIGNVYQLDANSTFKVGLEITVPDPNLTRTTTNGRPAATAAKPLGVQTVSAQIISSGTNVVSPVGDSNSPPHWTNDGADFSVDQTPDAFGAAFVTLNDIGADGDLDVDGAGFLNTGFTTGTTATSLGKTQYGAAGAANNPGPMLISLGDYTAANVSVPTQTDLHTNVNSAAVFADANATGSSPNLTAVAPSSISNGAIQIQVNPVPEPASLGLLGIAGLALIRRRK